jgi:hypothetical protein
MKNMLQKWGLWANRYAVLGLVVVGSVFGALGAQAEPAPEFTPVDVSVFEVFDFEVVAYSVLALAGAALGGAAVVTLGVGWGKRFIAWVGGRK